MTYLEALNLKTEIDIENILRQKVSEEAEQAYQANLKEKLSLGVPFMKAVSDCSGTYVGAWWRLMNAWQTSKVTLSQVINSLTLNLVANDESNVVFTPAVKLKLKSKKRIGAL